MNRTIPLTLLLCGALALLAWKAVRTDWIVVVPYVFYDSDLPGSKEYGSHVMVLPISPLWHPPKPNQVDPFTTAQWRTPGDYPTGYQSWVEFFPGSGTMDIAGPPQLQPNWTLIAFKITGSFALLFLTITLFRRVTIDPASTSTLNACVAEQDAP